MAHFDGFLALNFFYQDAARSCVFWAQWVWLMNILQRKW